MKFITVHSPKDPDPSIINSDVVEVSINAEKINMLSRESGDRFTLISIGANMMLAKETIEDIEGLIIEEEWSDEEHAIRRRAQIRRKMRVEEMTRRPIPRERKPGDDDHIPSPGVAFGPTSKVI